MNMQVRLLILAHSFYSSLTMMLFRPSKFKPLSQIRMVKSMPDFSGALNEKYFDFQNEESKIYRWWEDSKYFEPLQCSKNSKKFTMAMPPPNVTGYLHMGHAIFLTIQDIFTRFHRMNGFETLWVPGT
jgi:valyl-tRNA synthetase